MLLLLQQQLPGQVLPGQVLPGQVLLLMLL
jgi:hypothetical protein